MSFPSPVAPRLSDRLFEQFPIPSIGRTSSDEGLRKKGKKTSPTHSAASQERMRSVSAPLLSKTAAKQTNARMKDRETITRPANPTISSQGIHQLEPSPKAEEPKLPESSPKNASFGSTPNAEAHRVTPVKISGNSPPRSHFSGPKPSFTPRRGFSLKHCAFSPPKASHHEALQKKMNTLVTSLSLDAISTSNESNNSSSIPLITLEPAGAMIPVEAVKKPALAKFPPSVFFIIADKLLNDVQGLKEASALFADYCSAEDGQKGKSALDTMTDFLMQNVQRIQQVLRAVDYKTQSLPADWKEAIEKAGITVTGLKATSLDDQQLALFLKFFPNLKELKVHKCILAKDSVAAISQLKALHTLNISCCTLSDDSLSQILSSFKSATQETGRLKNLSILWCDTLTDEGLKPLAQLSGLVKLNLNGCRRVTDAVFDLLTTHTDLEELHLNSCIQITSKGLQKLANTQVVKKLSTLNLTFCKGVFRNGLDAVLKFESLRALILRKFDHKLTSDTFPKFVELKQLRFLDLSSSEINDSMLIELKRLHQLNSLDMRSTKGYSPALVDTLKASSSLRSLLTGPRSSTPVIRQKTPVTLNPARSPEPAYVID